VVDVEEADRAGYVVMLDGAVAGEKAGVVGAIDEGVDGVAVGGDAGGGDGAVVVGEVVGSWMLRAPRLVVSSQAWWASSTQRAIARTPSPWV